VHIRERYRHGVGVVTYLARYLRGGPMQNSRLVAYDGDRGTFTCRPRQEEADGGGASAPRSTVSVVAFLQRWLLPVPVPQTRGVRAYGLYQPTQAEAFASCRAALGQPPVATPVVLAWQTVCAQRGEQPPERCPVCGQLLVCPGVVPRGGAPPPGLAGERAA
jgi:Putative transposase